MRIPLGIVPGTTLWRVNPPEFILKVRRHLYRLGAPEHKTMSLKMFRTGKACSMAASGESLQQILEAGEWRSRSISNYARSELVDEMSVLSQTINLSDEKD